MLIQQTKVLDLSQPHVSSHGYRLIDESTRNEFCGAWIAGGVEELLSWRHFNQLAIQQQGDPCCQALCLKDIVCHQNNGGVGGCVLFTDEVFNKLHVIGFEIGC